MVGSISGVGSCFFTYRYEFSGGGSSAQRTGMQPKAAGNVDASAVSAASVSYSSPWLTGSTSASVSNGSFPVSGSMGGKIPLIFSANTGDVIPDLFIRKGADPAEYAVRMRMQYAEPSVADLPGQEDTLEGVQGTTKSPEDEKCQTCEQRKYQDGSNDMGVSFKTPTRIAPEAAGAMVRSHEQEHVTRERAKAEREDREVVSQSVTLHTDVCPECGKVYISGGTTQTTTVSKSEPVESTGPDEAQRRPFSAVA